MMNTLGSQKMNDDCRKSAISYPVDECITNQAHRIKRNKVDGDFI